MLSRVSKSLLIALVTLSLLANAFLIFEWLTLRQSMQRALSQTIADLDSIQRSNVGFTVHLKQDFPVRATVPLQKTLTVPLRLTLPVRQQVSTTVNVAVPGIGVSVPVSVTVPLQLDVPVNMQVPVPISETVAISTTFPVDMDVPVAVNLQEAGLSGYLQRLQAALSNLKNTP